MRFSKHLFIFWGSVAVCTATGCIDVTCAERGTCPVDDDGESSGDESTNTSRPSSQASLTSSDTGVSTESGSSGMDGTSLSSSTGSEAPSSQACTGLACSCADGGCIEAGVELGCTEEQAALCSGSQAICIIDSGLPACVECSEDIDCPSSEPVCVTNQCQVCELGSDRGCTVTTPFCIERFASLTDAGDSATLGSLSSLAGDAAPDASASTTDSDASARDAQANDADDAGETSSAETSRTLVCAECYGSTGCSIEAPVCLDGACVECTSDSDCGDSAAARCDLATHSCAPCEQSAQCAHLSGTNVCNTAAGTCVECTAAERTACGDHVCKTTPGEDQFTCSTQSVGSIGGCHPCASDAACAEGHACVLETFNDGPSQWVCLQQQGAGTGQVASCAANQPVTGTLTTASVDNVEGTFCRPKQTTCSAYLHYGSTGSGQGIWCTSNDDCGLPNVDDGWCLPYGDNPEERLCSYACLVDMECRANADCTTVPGQNGLAACTL